MFCNVLGLIGVKTFSVPIATGLKVKDMGAGCYISEILAFDTTKIQVSTILVAFKSDKELYGGGGLLSERTRAPRLSERKRLLIQ